ncbi:MAG: TPM domain-containing protein [Treponemataceae bacterium]
MTHKYFIKKIALQPEDFEAIKTTVSNIEKKTTGEIAIALISESDNYLLHELLFAFLVGVISFVTMVTQTHIIASFLDTILWHFNLWHISAFFGLATLAIMIGVFYLANIPFIDRLIIPSSAMKKSVYTRALRHFIESGVYQTREDSGILIFISYLEKEVRIIADSGVILKVSQAKWNEISQQLAQKIAQGFKEKKVASSLVEAVEICGSVLQEYFPAKADNPNELSDGLVILECD